MNLCDKVSIGFNRVDDDEKLRLETEAAANKKHSKYRQSNEQTEAETGLIVSVIQEPDTEDQPITRYGVRVDRDLGPPRLRVLDEDQLTVI